MKRGSPALRVRRVYEAPDAGDGTRVLVDRLWPRGINKERAQIDAWLKDLAPSHELRRRFHGHPEAWDEFVATYADELCAPAAAAAVHGLRELAATGHVTLLYAARDETHNNAVALKLWLERT
jgi:uncharacterized protein YeaO (DUF488 family)